MSERDGIKIYRVKIDDNYEKRVGINLPQNTNPQSPLDVKGDICVCARASDLFPHIYFKDNENNKLSMIQSDHSSHRLDFILYNSDASHYDRYTFPAPDSGASSSVSYDILTKKTHNINSISDFSVPQNSSTTFTVANSTRAFIVCMGGGSQSQGAYIVCATSAGAMSSSAVKEATGITVTTPSANHLTIQSTTGNALRCLVFCAAGSITT